MPRVRLKDGSPSFRVFVSKRWYLEIAYLRQFLRRLELYYFHIANPSSGEHRVSATGSMWTIYRSYWISFPSYAYKAQLVVIRILFDRSEVRAVHVHMAIIFFEVLFLSFSSSSSPHSDWILLLVNLLSPRNHWEKLRSFFQSWPFLITHFWRSLFTLKRSRIKHPSLGHQRKNLVTINHQEKSCFWGIKLGLYILSCGFLPRIPVTNFRFSSGSPILIVSS